MRTEQNNNARPERPAKRGRGRISRGEDFQVLRYDEGLDRFIPMANEVLGVGPDVEVEHINGNPFDNRKCNLRVVTRPADSSLQSASPKQEAPPEQGKA